VVSNPYTNAIRRCFDIVIGVIGALVGLGSAGHMILTGHAPRIGVRSIGPGYGVDAAPSQFWFTVLFYAALGLGFAYIAWRAYRR
jgi:hypothetical protein